MSGNISGLPFGDIRRNWRNVQQQAAAGWSSLSQNSPKPSLLVPILLSPRHVKPSSGNSEIEVAKQKNDLEIGSNLLNKWQESWKEIHDADEENYEAARKVERTIIGLNGSVRNQQEAVRRLNECLLELPVIQNHLMGLTAKIGSLCEDFDILEAGLFELENISEILDFQRQMEHQRLAIKEHRGRRNFDLEKERREALVHHELLVRENDIRLQRKLNERQFAFAAEMDDEGDSSEINEKDLLDLGALSSAAEVPFAAEEKVLVAAEEKVLVAAQEPDAEKGKVPISAHEPVAVLGEVPVVTVGDEPVATVGDEPVVALGDMPVVAVGDEPFVAVGDEPVVAVGDEPVESLGEKSEVNANKVSGAEERMLPVATVDEVHDLAEEVHVTAVEAEVPVIVS